MKVSKIKSFDELPLFLNADLVAKTLGVAVSTAYELMHEKDFPAVRIGNRFLSSKETGGNHGFGLLQIDNIVSKYHGYLNRQTENGVFATEVMLPLVK